MCPPPAILAQYQHHVSTQRAVQEPMQSPYHWLLVLSQGNLSGKAGHIQFQSRPICLPNLSVIRGEAASLTG